MATTHLRITAKRDGFRRAGIAHPSATVDHPISNFTPHEIDALKREPNLVVAEVELELGTESKPKK